LIHIVLHGVALPLTEERPGRPRMPGFAWRLSDEEVAALTSFVRQGWHNQAAAVKVEEISPLR